MNVYLSSIGCRLNEAELQMWTTAFVKFGYQIVSHPDKADIVVLNSCTVTAEAARKSRKAIRRFKKHYPSVKLVVTGCYSSMENANALDQLEIDLVVPNLTKDHLVAEVEKTFSFLKTDPALQIYSEPDCQANDFENLLSRGMQRAFVKIQDGCRYRCTFCMVTLARGEERSRSHDEIISDITRLVAAGVNEVVLTGVHLGGYGSDIESSLAQLVSLILTRTAIRRLRISSLEPWNISNDMIDLFGNSRIMPHVHLPIQSGSNPILKRMARRGCVEDYAKLVAALRCVRPDISISSDIIVGFPGESESDWYMTMQTVKELAFSQLHIFPFSPRKGTVAATFDNAIPSEVIKSRCKALAQINQTLQDAYANRFIHSIEEVLLEKVVQEKTIQENAIQERMNGLTPHFIKTFITDPLCGVEKEPDYVTQPGDIVSVRIDQYVPELHAFRAHLVRT
jgi:threonylcarbamoyladenosine tRNA methylthiotransferase MtaB